MTYGFVVDVQAPAQVYDAVHAEVMRRAPGGADGLLLHVGWATADGFRVAEVWESREHCDRFDAEVVGPVVAQLTGGQAQPPPREEFEPRGLVVPSARVLV